MVLGSSLPGSKVSGGLVRDEILKRYPRDRYVCFSVNPLDNRAKTRELPESLRNVPCLVAPLAPYPRWRGARFYLPLVRALGFYLAALEKLEELGIPAQLTIVGCQPPGRFPGNNIRIIPYLNKKQDQDARLLEDLFLEADFFILPTRADASSIVAAEANAFGLPVISTCVGGLPTIIKDGINGYLLPLTARGEDFAKVIATVFRDERKYLELRATSRKEYENRLNWKVWTERVADVIAEALE